ncbi:site-specific integrase [Oscillatoria amoena NRMC-F 0135]|nr:site-specific integrase [Oscillatoria amoena NRMC-F 0135]
MATTTVILRKEVKADGTSPLAIRITQDRKSSYVYLDKSIKAEDWDSKARRVKKSHPNAARLNHFLVKKLAEASDMLLELEAQKNDVSAKAAREKLKPSSSDTFFAQAAFYIEQLKEAGKFNQSTADGPRIMRFKEFLKNEDIAFRDITVPLLQRFKTWLLATREIGERTAMNHLVVIRSIFSQAIKAGIVDPKYYPFGRGKITIKFPDSLKIGLSADEVKKLEEMELVPGSPESHARNLWLFSFYFAGMRVSDILRLKWSDFQDARLHYSMGKNKKGGSLKVSEKVMHILEQYESLRTDENDFVFPELKAFKEVDQFHLQKQIANADRTLNKWLRRVAKKAGITKPVTMHIARHTFGNLSGDKIPVQMLQKLYRHSSITTTIGYQANFINKDADDALDAVISF